MEYRDLFTEGDRKRFEAGDREALVRAISWCFEHRIEPPEWVYAAGHKALSQWGAGAKTLDEAFGVMRRGGHGNAQRKKAKYQRAVYQEAQRMIDDGHPNNEALFRKVCERLKIPVGPTRAREWFIELRDARNPHIERIPKRRKTVKRKEAKRQR